MQRAGPVGHAGAAAGARAGIHCHQLGSEPRPPTCTQGGTPGFSTSLLRLGARLRGRESNRPR